MTADTILYACNTVAVGLFGIVLSAAFSCTEGESVFVCFSMEQASS